MSLPTFVSQQVQQARRYFFDLNADINATLAIVCGGCERVKPDYVIQRSDFPFFCLELIAAGEGEAILNGERCALYPGVIFSYGPGVPHTIRTSPERPMLKYYIDFTGIEAPNLLASCGLPPGAHLHVNPVEEVIQVFDNLQRDSASEHPVAGDICLTLLKLLALKIRERAISAPSAEPKSLASYRRARQLIEQNGHLWRSADEAAQHCGITPEYLSRLFAKYGHTTPYKLIARIRLNRAAELLLDANLKVHEVAAELGFSDPFHFSRSFKSLYGASPEQFVKRIRGTAVV